LTPGWRDWCFVACLQLERLATLRRPKPTRSGGWQGECVGIRWSRSSSVPAVDSLLYATSNMGSSYVSHLTTCTTQSKQHDSLPPSSSLWKTDRPLKQTYCNCPSSTNCQWYIVRIPTTPNNDLAPERCQWPSWPGAGSSNTPIARHTQVRFPRRAKTSRRFFVAPGAPIWGLPGVSFLYFSSLFFFF